MVDSLVHGVTWLMERVGGSFVSPTARDGLLAILAGFAIGGFAFRYYFGRERFGIRAYLRHAFPRRVYWSRTFAVDVQIFLMDRLLAPMVWFTRVLSVVMVAHGLASGLTHWLGPVTQFGRGPVMTGLLAFALLLAVDLGTYVTHRLSHQVPVLWAFHRVHHSAEELNPLTLVRKHPVYNAFAVVVDCVTVAPLQGAILYLFGAAAEIEVLTLVDFGFVAFAYCAASLRHTHIWLSYGPVLDKIFVSPALHQIHHSKARRHFDKNFGEVLAIWDWLLRTHYQPREREELQFGIGDEAVQPHPHLVAAMLEPFAYAWRVVRKRPAPTAGENPLPDGQA
jgi:sterol desaturase/sphingolipid hydroxylase (fatty acid hydroxylase superfamily)